MAKSNSGNLNWMTSGEDSGSIKPGGLHASLGIPQGQTIPPAKINAAASKGGKVGKQARLAKTFAKFRPKKVAGR